MKNILKNNNNHTLKQVQTDIQTDPKPSIQKKLENPKEKMQDFRGDLIDITRSIVVIILMVIIMRVLS